MFVFFITNVIQNYLFLFYFFYFCNQNIHNPF
nr:MAG TPA_asm: hypothetical protein [Caudoviricetes sp.]